MRMNFESKPGMADLPSQGRPWDCIGLGGDLSTGDKANFTVEKEKFLKICKPLHAASVSIFLHFSVLDS